MAELKNSKYIITELNEGSRRAPPRRTAAGAPDPGEKSHLRLLYLDDEVIQGAFYTECVWIWPGKEFYPTAAEPEVHAHDFDEVITFFGTDFEHPNELCGEIELGLGDERYILTKSCMVFVPKGLKHGPLIIRRVDRPIFHFATGPGRTYIKGQK